MRYGDHDYLAPEDADTRDIPDTCIDYDAMKARLETRQPRRCLLITDACRNIFAGKGDGRNAFGKSAFLGNRITPS